MGSTELREHSTGAEECRISRIFESLPDGHDSFADEIEGHLPRELKGTLYRNGPGQNDLAGTPFDHLFDGAGMLSQFIFDGRRVRYRNRFVETKHYLDERQAGRPRSRHFGTDKPGGPLANAFRLPGHMANTSVVIHAGQLLALCEAHRPYRLDADTLETLGEHDFARRLKKTHVFSAHPKWDAETGEMFNFGLQYGLRTRIRTYRVDRGGHLQHLASVPLPYAVWCHDFALTEKHLVFVLDPLLVDLPGLILGLRTFDGSLRWDPQKATRIVLVPRDGSPVRVSECEAFYHVHVANAFEDRSDTVVDLVRYQDFEFGEYVRNYREARLSAESALVRLRIRPAGTVDSQELCPWNGEFPQFDQRRSTRENRFTYYAGNPDGADFAGALIKVDNRSGRRWAHRLPWPEFVSEPTFVPAAERSDEDEGWLLALVYSPEEHRSKLIVVDARDLEDDPVAVVHLRHHVPPDFHGMFTARIANPPMPQRPKD